MIMHNNVKRRWDKGSLMRNNTFPYWMKKLYCRNKCREKEVDATIGHNNTAN